jgi:hypothetical protein
MRSMLRMKFGYFKINSCSRYILKGHSHIHLQKLPKLVELAAESRF